MSRAQIKMFETVGVLVVFFFLLITGAVFYFKIQESSLKQEIVNQAQLKNVQTAQRAMFLPELDCSFLSIPRENCFDQYKLKALANIMKDSQMNDLYFGLFGYATVSVSEFYPEPNFRATIYNNTPEEYKRAPTFFSSVLLYDPITRANNFGVMEVTNYGKD